MKKFAILTFALSFAFPLFGQSPKPNCKNLQGDWVNELESVITINKVTETGPGYGTFEGLYKPPGSAGKVFALSGLYNDVAGSGHQAKALTFSVQWRDWGTLTTWACTCQEVNGVPTLKSVLHIIRANADVAWSHVTTNTETFVPK
ncbi:hypothetical protein SCOR_34780 [Sulfidibacter corallicola]|uniref:Avidin family protein n=1 Tax=Sulfidibacter corallicola TaxID=2818388 RepID=A0A8A4TGV3_SULCO|nr:avidin/streptavidin family protein [Sulfidibacter corallicola]QTD49299.1 hypothetical protein J3U87_27250 [Sulfidibacter corallicola]